MKTKNIVSYTFAGLLVSGALLTTLTGCETGHCGKGKGQCPMTAQAKVSREDAEKTALAKVPGGTIKDGELEKEKGKLIWSFDITTPDSKDITEVNVCAISGAVLSVEKESPKEAAKEKAEDAKKEKKHKKDKDNDEKEEKGEHKDKE